MTRVMAQLTLRKKWKIYMTETQYYKPFCKSTFLRVGRNACNTREHRHTGDRHCIIQQVSISNSKSNYPLEIDTDTWLASLPPSEQDDIRRDIRKERQRHYTTLARATGDTVTEEQRVLFSTKRKEEEALLAYLPDQMGGTGHLIDLG